MEKIKMLFSKDISEALRSAREDERRKCEIEKIQALEKQRQRIEGDYSLKLKEKEIEMESILFRMDDVTKREKQITADIYAIRETEILLRRMASDLIYALRKKHEEETKVLQNFEKLDGDILTIESKLLKLER